MNILCSGLILFLFATFASAQETPPDVTLLQNKWRLEVRNRALDVDPLKANKDRESEVRQQQATAENNENRVRQGEPTLPPPVTQPTPGASGISAVYIYEVTAKNTGPKKIRSITWEYVFFEPGTTHELGRRRFVSKVEIRSGATKDLIVRSISSPTGTVDAKKAGKSTSDQYSEKVIIQRIEYADGSVWPAALR